MDPNTNPQPQPADVYLFGDPALRLFGGTETEAVTSTRPGEFDDVSAA